MINFTNSGILSSATTGERAPRDAQNAAGGGLFGVHFRAEDDPNNAITASHPPRHAQAPVPSKAPYPEAGDFLHQPDASGAVAKSSAITPDSHTGSLADIPAIALPVTAPADRAVQTHSTQPGETARQLDSESSHRAPAPEAQRPFEKISRLITGNATLSSQDGEKPAATLQPQNRADGVAPKGSPLAPKAFFGTSTDAPAQAVQTARSQTDISSLSAGDQLVGKDINALAADRDIARAGSILNSPQHGRSASDAPQAGFAKAPTPISASVPQDQTTAQSQSRGHHPAQIQGLSTDNPNSDNGRSLKTATQPAPEKAGAELPHGPSTQSVESRLPASTSSAPQATTSPAIPIPINTDPTRTSPSNRRDSISAAQFPNQPAPNQPELPPLTASSNSSDTEPPALTTRGLSSTIPVSADTPSVAPAAPAAPTPSSVTPAAPTITNGIPATGVERGGALPQIATAIQVSLVNHSNLEIRLDPPDLGRVIIDFSFEKDGSIIALLNSDNDDTSSLLRRHSDQLIKELTNAGFDDVKLEFGSEFNKQSNQNQENDGDSPAPDAWPDRSRADDRSPDPLPNEQTISPFIAGGPRNGTGPLDIRL